MKILMMIPLWRRPEVVRLFIDRFNVPDYAEVTPLFILSKEDPDIGVLRLIIKGFKSIVRPNEPLGAKKNDGMMYALKSNWDYYMDMGSDNVWNPVMWQMYKPYFDKGTEYFGLKNIYSLNRLDNIANFTEGYHKDMFTEKPTALGVGRCIKRNIVEANVPLWRADWPRGLDGCSHYKLRKAGVDCEVIDNARIPTILDIKTLTNLTLHLEIDTPESRVDPNWVRAAFGISVYQSHCSDFRGHDDFEVFHTTVLKESNDTPTKRDAFNSVNIKYEIETGKRLYKNYNTYLATVSRKHRKP